MNKKRAMNGKNRNNNNSLFDALVLTLKVTWHFVSIDKLLLSGLMTISLLSAFYSSFSHNVIHGFIDNIANIATCSTTSQNDKIPMINKLLFMQIIFALIQLTLFHIKSKLDIAIRPYVTSVIRFDIYKALKEREYDFFRLNQQANITDKLDEIADNMRSIFEFIIDQFIRVVASSVALLHTLYNIRDYFKVNALYGCLQTAIFFGLAIVLSSALLSIFSLVTLVALSSSNVSSVLYTRSKSFSEFIGVVCDSLNNVYSIKTLRASKEEDLHIKNFRDREIQSQAKFLQHLSRIKTILRIFTSAIHLVMLIYFHSTAVAYISATGIAATNISSTFHSSKDRFLGTFHNTSGLTDDANDYILEYTFVMEYVANLQKVIEFLLMEKIQSANKKDRSNKAIALLQSVRNEDDDCCTCNIKLTNYDLQLHNVSFTHVDGTRVIKNLNLFIKEGTNVGMAGTSGSGKSTLFSLILGLFRPTEGYITLGGHDIDNFCDYCFGHNVSLIPQSPVLFNRTVRENIEFSNSIDGHSIKEVQNAAHQACLHDIVMHFSEQYNFVVGNSGDKLSGGQRQRVAIARTFLKHQCNLLLIDEATSALDTITEHQVLENLYKNFKNRTIISIAHRLHTLKYTDRIIVLERGKIVEDGVFDTLITSRGYFDRMWNATQQQKRKTTGEP